VAKTRASHPCSIRREYSDCLPGLPACNRGICSPTRLFWRAVQLFPHELDQTKLPLDDVSLRVGHKTRTREALAVRLKRSFFEALLSRAVESTFSADRHSTRSDWEHAVAGSSVRLQWDPDHDPAGRPLPRRALQLGPRDSDLHAFGKTELVEIIDATEFVANQRRNAVQERWAQLLTPREVVYLPDLDMRRRLALSEA